MTLKLENKKAIVAEVAAVAKEALSAVIADYQGLTVTDMTKLRTRARASDVYLKVVRNTLARRAVADTEFVCLQEALTGPLVLAFSKADPGAAARLFRDFVKETDKLQVKALALNGKLLPGSQLDVVANLPTRDEALAILMGVMKAPVEKFVRTLAEPHAKLVRTVGAIRDQKQAA